MGPNLQGRECTPRSKARVQCFKTPECDRQTGQTDGIHLASTALGIARRAAATGHNHPTSAQDTNDDDAADFINISSKFLANVNSCSSVCRLSSLCRLSVAFVHPTQTSEICGNISTPFGTLAICWHPGKILRRSSQGNPSVGGVKHKRGSRI